MSTTPGDALPANSGAQPRHEPAVELARLFLNLRAGRVLARVLMAADFLMLAFELLRSPLGIAASVASRVEEAWGALLVVGGFALLAMLVWRGRALFGMLLRPTRLLVYACLGFVLFLLVQSGFAVVSDIVTGKTRGTSPLADVALVWSLSPLPPILVTAFWLIPMFFLPLLLAASHRHWTRVLEQQAAPQDRAPQPGRSSAFFGRAVVIVFLLALPLAFASLIASAEQAKSVNDILNYALGGIDIVWTALVIAMLVGCVARGWPRLFPFFAAWHWAVLLTVVAIALIANGYAYLVRVVYHGALAPLTLPSTPMTDYANAIASAASLFVILGALGWSLGWGYRAAPATQASGAGA